MYQLGTLRGPTVYHAGLLSALVSTKLKPPVRPARKQPSQTQVQSERAQALRRRRRKNWTTFLLFAGPNIALIIMFIYYPVVANIRYSTLNWRLGADTATFVSLDNYIQFFTSPNRLEVWRVTIIFTLAAATRLAICRGPKHLTCPRGDRLMLRLVLICRHGTVTWRFLIASDQTSHALM
jgi:hypothetical protein